MKTPMICVMLLATSLIPTQSLVARAAQAAATNKPAAQAQQEKDANERVDLPDMNAINLAPAVTLPQGENAWSIQILSRGGLTGRGRGDLTVTSDGSLAWTSDVRSCGGKLPDDQLLEITKVVVTLGRLSTSKGTIPVGGCYDCYVTTMILQRREADGMGHRYAVSWNDTSYKQVPAEVLQLSETLMAQLLAHKGCER